MPILKGRKDLERLTSGANRERSVFHGGYYRLDDSSMANDSDIFTSHISRCVEDTERSSTHTCLLS